MGATGKSAQANKKKKSGKCDIQFNRTVGRTGRWRGKKASDYVRYKKKKKKRIFNAPSKNKNRDESKNRKQKI